MEEGAGTMHFRAHQAKAKGQDSFTLGGEKYPVSVEEAGRGKSLRGIAKMNQIFQPKDPDLVDPNYRSEIVDNDRYTINLIGDELEGQIDFHDNSRSIEPDPADSMISYIYRKEGNKYVAYDQDETNVITSASSLQNLKTLLIDIARHDLGQSDFDDQGDEGDGDEGDDEDDYWQDFDVREETTSQPPENNQPNMEGAYMEEVVCETCKCDPCACPDQEIMEWLQRFGKQDVEEGLGSKMAALGTAAAIGLGSLGGAPAQAATPGSKPAKVSSSEKQRQDLAQAQQLALKLMGVNKEFGKEYYSLIQQRDQDYEKTVPKVKNNMTMAEVRDVEMAKANVEQRFLSDLQTLLEKYGAMKEEATGDQPDQEIMEWLQRFNRLG
jgi:hypothetical protein